MQNYNSMFKFLFVFLIINSFIKVPIQAQFQPSGMVKLIKVSAVIIRNVGEIKLTKIKFNIKNKDIIRTTQSGKVLFTLLGGDHVFMAPNTEIKYVENKGKKGLVNILNRNLHLKGRLLARIRKNLARTVVIRTANAIVGVKGTEFVTEFINKTTNVGTIKGLVSLTSLANNQSVELKEGTMSSVNIDGEVLQPSEFSGILMRDFEFAGEKMSGEDAAGKKIKLD